MTKVNYWNDHEIMGAIKLTGASDRNLLHITSIYGATKIVIRERNEELRAYPATTEGFGSSRVLIFPDDRYAIIIYKRFPHCGPSVTGMRWILSERASHSEIWCVLCCHF